jgi:uncharacterized protein (TIGR02265 family)
MSASKPEEPLAFASMVEGLRRAMGTLDERTHRKFEELGLPMRGKMEQTYPRDLWVRVCLFAGQQLNPTFSPEQQRVALGRRFVQGYAETLVGKALLAAMRVLGPKRALARLERSFRTGNNYSRVTFRETEGGGIELDVLGAPYPEWYEGMVYESLVVTGAKDIEVKAVKFQPPELTTYRVSFRT